MPQSLEMQIRTLTPLWTGGLKGAPEQLHISNLMGSLRYWYEAFVRGVGGYACEPIEGRGCNYTPFNEKDPHHTGKKSLCSACYFFGTTGWARLFRLSTMMQIDKDYKMESVNMLIKKGMRKDVPVGFRAINDKALSFKMIFRTVSDSMEPKEKISAKQHLTMLLRFISSYAGLGPKQQRGRGAVKITFPDEPEMDNWSEQQFKLDLQALHEYCKEFKSRPKPPECPQDISEWPDLRQFFSFTTKHTTLPVKVSAPQARKDEYGLLFETPMKISAMRTWMMEERKGPPDLNLLLGTLRPETRSSRIFLDFHPVPEGYSLHLYGFGVAGDPERDRTKLVPLLEEYIGTTWPDAKIATAKRWDVALLPVVGGK